jgi:hypothetical protein
VGDALHRNTTVPHLRRRAGARIDGADDFVGIVSADLETARFPAGERMAVS